MEPAELCRLVNDLGKASATLSESELACCQRLSHVLCEAARKQWRLLIADMPSDPVLQIYMSDGWGGEVRSCSTGTVGAHTLLRRGKLRREFSLQRSFMKKCRVDGTMLTCMRIAEPVGLGLGRTVWRMFQAGCEFEATPRALGDSGITISAYLFDGCMFSALARHFTARHELYYSRNHGFDHGPDHAELWAMDWVLPVKRIAHACSNVVAWGLKGLNLEQRRDDTHIAIAALMNARTFLRVRVGSFVAIHLCFSKDRSGSTHEVACFWRALQVEPHFVDLLSELDLQWDDGQLKVNDSWARREGVVDTISSCLLYLLSWTSFSETRWAKVGVRGRKYLGSLAAGVDRIWRLCMDDPAISNYRLSGYSRAGPSARLLLSISACSALPAESMLLEVFEDDRCLRRATELWEAATSEVNYLKGIPGYVWERIVGSARLDVNGEAFRGQALRTTHTTLGYLWQEAFEPLRRLPLSLTQGDVAEQLDKLESMGESLIEDPLSKKVRRLLDSGLSRARLIRAIGLMREVPGGTDLVEQNHAAGAGLLRYRETYAEPSLRSRSAVHQRRHLVGKSLLERREAKLKARIALQQRQAKAVVAGRNLFLRKLSQEQDAGEAVRGVAAFARTQSIVKEHAQKYEALPKGEKRLLELAARSECRKRAKACALEKEVLESQLELLRQRARQEGRRWAS